MRFLSIWVSEHRELLIGILAAILWIAANAIYWRGDIARIMRQRRGHTWSVDMEAKTGKGGQRDMH